MGQEKLLVLLRMFVNLLPRRRMGEKKHGLTRSMEEAQAHIGAVSIKQRPTTVASRVTTKTCVDSIQALSFRASF